MLRKSEIIIALGVVCFFVICYAAASAIFQNTAYEIVVKSDLENFKKSQHNNWMLAGTFIGYQGEQLSADVASSDFHFADWAPSEGLVITVVSGNPGQPFDENSPYVVEITHNKLDKIIEYNFATHTLTEKQ
ncbi:MAG: hypothetical protein N839_0012295 [Desulfofustis sp. PB-SRB1]|jgi:hypothetical protein|nr:hypothetical protein [Desulfofustis sp. PB-SRB1]MBM1003178.1 hypothetical protein [Desulfofustis sp. PB-SRB1]HBH28484.1 hypothetical protein [Desulfofustis sp.]